MTTPNRPPSCDKLKPKLKECPFCGKLRSEIKTLKKFLRESQKGAERNARVNQLLIQRLNEANTQDSIPRRSEVKELLRLVDVVHKENIGPPDKWAKKRKQLVQCADKIRREWKL